MAKKKGRALVVTWEGTKIGNVTSISLSVDGEIINVNDWDTGGWNDKLDGQKDWTMEVSAYHNSEGSTKPQSLMEISMISGDRTGTVTFGPETTTTDDVTYEGDVYLNNFSVDASGPDEAIESSFSIEGNGALTRTVAV